MKKKFKITGKELIDAGVTGEVDLKVKKVINSKKVVFAFGNQYFDSLEEVISQATLEGETIAGFYDSDEDTKEEFEFSESLASKSHTMDNISDTENAFTEENLNKIGKPLLNPTLKPSTDKCDEPDYTLSEGNLKTMNIDIKELKENATNFVRSVNDSLDYQMYVSNNFGFMDKLMTREQYKKWREDTKEAREQLEKEREAKQDLATEKFTEHFRDMEKYFEENNCDFREFLDEMGYTAY